MASTTSWKPTKKWLTLVLVGLASIGANWIESGEFDKTEQGMLVTLVVSSAGAYFKRNDVTPSGDGVPAPQGSAMTGDEVGV